VELDHHTTMAFAPTIAFAITIPTATAFNQWNRRLSNEARL
jgi:hypothetical protein